VEDQGRPVSEPRPLLALGPPSSGPIPAGPPAFRPLPRGPSAGRQGQRLTPQFDALQQALAAQRVSAGAETEESDPELVVVFDVAGSVDGFMRAVAQVDGLSFLAEIEEDEHAPDDDFFVADRDGGPTDDAVPETLYLVLTNTEAVAQLVRLFELWQADPTVTFERGLAPLKDAFAHLRAVRRWGPQDRVRETGLLEQWEEDVAVVGGQGRARVEIELWFRSDTSARQTAQATVQRLVREAGGAVLDSASLPGVQYHALLAEIPYDQVQAVLDDGPEAIELLTTDAIMFVTPHLPMSVPTGQPAAGSSPQVGPVPPPTMVPRVALLDGLPLANHDALVGRLVVDDPNNVAARYTSDRQYHGTAMASLLCHGDLTKPGVALSTPVYVTPILEPHALLGGEVVLQDRLLVDVLHSAFVRMFEGSGGAVPAAPSVRIVNLSIGDPARAFARRVSPVARLLDWLALRYNVLILVSAGNHSCQPDVDADVVRDPERLRQAVLEARFATARQRRLLAPAEAVNALTVGALHTDAVRGALPDSVLDGVTEGHPAAYSAAGAGHRRSVKPEILLPGGRQLFGRPPASASGSLALTAVPQAAAGPGLLTAAPDRRGGSSGTAFSCGTSNATALATRTANEIFDVLASLAPGPDEHPFPDAQYHPVLTKALLVHAAGWGDVGTSLRLALGLTGRTAKRDLAQLLGYGPLDPGRVATAESTRVLLLGAGSIAAGQRQQLLLPLPAALDRTTQWRRLTVTMAWLSPVNPRSFVHRIARLRCRVDEAKLRLDRQEVDANAVRRGTVQHEVFESRSAVVLAPRDVLSLDVDCRVDAGRLEAPVRYGVAVSLEVAATAQVDIHAQVRTGLRVQARQRVAGRG
jgi:hypothetical protein